MDAWQTTYLGMRGQWTERRQIDAHFKDTKVLCGGLSQQWWSDDWDYKESAEMGLTPSMAVLAVS